MKSKVLFWLDQNNRAIIKATVVPSENDEVRDIIAQRFKEGFGHSSVLALAHFVGEQEVHIIPISPNDLTTQNLDADMPAARAVMEAFYRMHPPVAAPASKYDETLDEILKLRNRPDFMGPVPAIVHVANSQFFVNRDGVAYSFVTEHHEVDLLTFCNQNISSTIFVKEAGPTWVRAVAVDTNERKVQPKSPDRLVSLMETIVHAFSRAHRLPRIVAVRANRRSTSSKYKFEQAYDSGLVVFKTSKELDLAQCQENSDTFFCDRVMEILMDGLLEAKSEDMNMMFVGQNRVSGDNMYSFKGTGYMKNKTGDLIVQPKFTIDYNEFYESGISLHKERKMEQKYRSGKLVDKTVWGVEFDDKFVSVVGVSVNGKVILTSGMGTNLQTYFAILRDNENRMTDFEYTDNQENAVLIIPEAIWKP